MFAKQSLQRIVSLNGPARAQSLLQAFRPSILAAVANKGFSSSISEGAKKLTRALEKEIKYENENYTQLEDIEAFLKESGFGFTEQADGIFMSLKKQVGDKTVEITFEAR